MSQEKQRSVKQDLEQRVSLEKWAPKIETAEDLRIVLDQAFDYRGDVTLTTRSGEKIVGYVFNRMTEGIAEPYIEFYPRGSDRPGRLACKEIESVLFSGMDPAAGRSWEAWVKKCEEKKKAQSEGRDIGEIEPQPMSLDDRDA